MSDPVTNIQIEDVLSSIRRLVSEESRLESRSVPKEKPREQDRLVLTPALRVADDPRVDDVSEAKHAENPEPADEPVSAELETLTLSDPIEQVSEAVEEADGSEHGSEPWQNPETTLFEAAQTPIEDDDLADDPDVAEETAAQTPTEAEDFDDGYDDADVVPDEIEEADVVYDEDPQDEVETVASHEVEHFDDQDNAPQPQYEDIDAEAEAAEFAQDDPEGDVNDAETADEVGESDDTYEAEFEVSDATTEVMEDPDLSHDARAESLSAKIEALEAAIGKTKDQWEPDGEIGDDYAGTVHVAPMAWRDHEAEANAAEGGDSAELGDLDEAVLDEDSLRELVSDIVRQELQGALGERITRNVRKLVRREIHRALAAQELD